PLISNDPAADATDLYAWRRGTAAQATVVLVANYYPVGVPYAGPNFYYFDDNVLYEIKIDNTGDAKPDVIYQFRFKTTLKPSPLGAAHPSFLNAFAPVTAGAKAFKNDGRSEEHTSELQSLAY